MIRMKSLAAITGAALMFTSGAVYADMANGSYSTNFTSIVPIWDISGSYSADPGLGVGLDFSITEDPSGKLAGGGTFNYDTGYGTISGDINVFGKVKSAGTVTRVSMVILISGTGTIQGDDIAFNAKVNYNCEIDSIANELTITGGSIHVTAKDLTAHRSQSASISLLKAIQQGGVSPVIPLPAGATDSWNLSLDLSSNGNKYTGTAEANLNGNVVTFDTVKGNYTSKKDLSKIALKGPKGTGANLKLVISTSGGQMTISTMSGKLFGQKIKFKAQ